MTQQLLNSDDRINEFDIRHLVIEDDTPVDNFQSEKQQRLLVDPLHSTSALTPPFLVAANVGVFSEKKNDPIVPDVFLSLGVECADDFSKRENRSYFVWEFGKVPDVCIEIVSNQEGDEIKLSKRSQQKGKTSAKPELYAQMRVPYYVVFDPLRQIGEQMGGALLRVWKLEGDCYVEITPPEGLCQVGEFVWLEQVGLGLALWEGIFEERFPRVWLRWCDCDGTIIPTGKEGKAIAEERTLLEQQRADAEQQRADAEQQRADAERQRAERLAEYLRSLGIDPNEIQ